MDLDLTEGWTSPLDFLLEYQTITDQNPQPQPLAGMQVTLILKDNQGSTVDVAGDTSVLTPDTAGMVRYVPDAADLVVSKSPYTARWQVTDGAGGIAFFPRPARDLEDLQAVTVKVPKKRRKLSPRRRRYAVARGRGRTRAEAARKAGYRGVRARKGVTGWELERDPKVVALMQDTMAKDMSETEVKNRLAAQARGELPTKVVVGSDGARQEFETNTALNGITKILGMNSETHRLELPEDKDEALEEIQTFLKLFGVEATIEEITARLEAAGGR